MSLIKKLPILFGIATVLTSLCGCQNTSTAPPTNKPSIPLPKENSVNGDQYQIPSVSAQRDYVENRIKQEVMLHAAMYRAAFQYRVNKDALYFVLEPVQEENAPDLGVDPANFRRQVLERLSELGAPFAWVSSTWRTTGADFFPSTNHKATRLRIKIVHRDQEQATVKGEVSDVTRDEPSSRQAVTATWDGQNWIIERDRAQVVW